MSQEVIAKMRARVAQCWRLADSITDPETARILRQMGDEIQADIRKLETGQPVRDAD